jgi:ribonuclease P/MRP protein subunit RPP40
MKLNYSKCKVMHIGSYFMIDNESQTTHQLVVTKSERDLGITIRDDLKWRTHAATISSKANSILGWFKSVFMCRDVKLWTRLYSTYISPHLEFAAPVNLYSIKNIELVEKVQRRATKVPDKLKRFDYATRLSKVGLTRLDQRRDRGDCIQAFKLVNKLEIVDWRVPPKIIPPMRGNRERMRAEAVLNCVSRHYFFSNRIASKWNALSDHVVEASSVNQFKSRYDESVRKR